MDIFTQWAGVVAATVNKYARSVPSDHKDDLKQECFLAILEKQPAIDNITPQGPEHVKRYVIQICRNRIVDSLRKDGKHEDCVSLETGPFCPEHPVAKEDFGVSELELDEAVNTLPAHEQYLIRSIYFRNMTEKEVGVTLGKSQQWVNVEKQRAIGKLREILEEGTI